MSEKQVGKRPQQIPNHPRAPPPIPPPNCPRCSSANTKFCYYNNYSVSQPRYFCKDCRRYWTHGGVIRNIPSGRTGRKRVRHDSTPSPPSGLLVSSTPQTTTHCHVSFRHNSACVGVDSGIDRGTFWHDRGFFNQNLSNTSPGGLNNVFGAVNIVSTGEASRPQVPSTIVLPGFSSLDGFNDFCYPFLQQPQFQPPIIWTGQNLGLNGCSSTLTGTNNVLRVARDPTRGSNVVNVNGWSELDDMDMKNESNPLQSFNLPSP